MRRRPIPGIVVLLLTLLMGGRAAAQPAERTPIVFDTDLGTDVDDAFALALILASPELDLRGVSTAGSDPEKRALMLCRFLTMTGRRHTPVAAGADPQPARPITGQHQYYYHPDVLFNRTTRPAKESAVDFLHARLKAQPGKVTIVAAGPLTNLALLLTERPACKPWVGGIILGGGNLPADPAAARTVLAAGIPITVVPAEIAAGLKLSPPDVRRVFRPGTPLTQQVQALYQLWDGTEPALADPLAVALCIEERFCTFADQHVEVDDKGAVRVGNGKPNARVATAVRRDEFLRWYVERMASCVRPAERPATPVPKGGMPARVHVAEDYDTDIERRWWMAGKAETTNPPPDSRRACRGVLTHDFDDLLGNPRAMHTAVIFNPVPGPPMGKQTRLNFRYWLQGTDTLRVQIYSLTNGYHRHLVLKDLPQGRWEAATVDMTVARRADGTGGPLSEGERIDDIQFYADPSAELRVDDLILYDAARPDETRPFPKRVVFTGGFDSGKQGKEWPGTFEIVAQKGYFWHGARAVDLPDLKATGIKLGLRGERTLGKTTRLTFRYHLTGADTVSVALAHGARASRPVTLKSLRAGDWAEATVDFTGAGDRADAIHFLLPTGGELIIDDVLLFEPGPGDR